MKLEDYKKRRPFRTPEGYFAELNRKISEATVNAPAKEPAAKRFRIGVFAKWTNIAAMFIILCTIAIGLFDTNEETIPVNNTPQQKQVDKTANRKVAEYEENDIIDNIMENYSIDEYTFYCYLTEYE